MDTVASRTRVEKSPRITLPPGPGKRGTRTACLPASGTRAPVPREAVPTAASQLPLPGSRPHVRPHWLLAGCGALLLVAVASAPLRQVAAPSYAAEGPVRVRTYSYGTSAAQTLDMHYRWGLKAAHGWSSFTAAAGLVATSRG